MRGLRWNGRKWIGGDSRTLYTFIDERTGQMSVRPTGMMNCLGSELTVRIATRAEAEEYWQRPLHPGWRVAS